MQRYIARRLLLMIPTLLGITVIVFGITHLTPQDVVDQLVGEQGSRDAELKQQLRDQFGLSGSLPKQYVKWLGKIATGNFGRSYLSGNSVTGELKNRVPVSVELGGLALAFAMIVGIPIGIISAVKQDTLVDYSTRGLAILILAVPSFFLALLVVTFGWRWFGWAEPSRYTPPWENLGNNLSMMLVPTLLLGIGLSGIQMRLMRTQMLEVLRQDYIRTARAKGLTETAVLVRHATKNALVPVLTVIGLQITVLIAGSVILEQIFLIPGIGQYVVNAAARKDYPIVQGLTLIFAVVIVMSNLVVDVAYAFLDPRVKYS